MGHHCIAYVVGGAFGRTIFLLDSSRACPVKCQVELGVDDDLASPAALQALKADMERFFGGEVERPCDVECLVWDENAV